MFICIYKYVTFIKNVINIIVNNLSIFMFTHFTIDDGNIGNFLNNVFLKIFIINVEMFFLCIY